MHTGRLAFVTGIIAVALSFAGCASPSSTPSPTGDSTSASASAVPTAQNMDGVKVTGAFGAQPKVTFTAPLYLGETQVKVLHQGTGSKVVKSGIVKVNYYGVNGRDGKVFDESFSGGTPVEFATDQVISGFQKGLEGQSVGSRILIGIPGSDGYDASGGSTDGSIQVGDTIFFVVDIVAASLETATGTEVTPAAGLPTVAFSDGKPTITIPDTSPPTTLKVQPLITGTGEKLTATSTVLVKYTGVSWTTKQVVEENWTNGESAALNTLIAGWQKGLVGQPVGSRVLLVVPPSLAYPNGNRAPKVEAGDTLVYVVDILYASSNG